jgi:hypothetical protein
LLRTSSRIPSFWLDADKPYADKRNPGWLTALAFAAYSPILVPIFAGQFVFTYLIGRPLVAAFRAFKAATNPRRSRKQ